MTPHKEEEQNSNHTFVPSSKRESLAKSIVEDMPPPQGAEKPDVADSMLQDDIIVVSSLVNPDAKSKKKKKRKQSLVEQDTDGRQETMQSLKKKKRALLEDGIAISNEDEGISILDQPVSTVTSSTPASYKRAKKQKQANGYEQPDFGRAPRDMATQSRGNKSATFT